MLLKDFVLNSDNYRSDSLEIVAVGVKVVKQLVGSECCRNFFITKHSIVCSTEMNIIKIISVTV